MLPEHLYNLANRHVRVKLHEVALELLALEKAVVKQVVDEVEKQLRLQRDLVVERHRPCEVLFTARQCQQDVNDHDDGTERSSHLVCHIFVTVPHRL